MGSALPVRGLLRDLGKLEKEIKIDHELALALWATSNHHARILATKVADPRALGPPKADMWLRNCDNYVLMDAVGRLVATTPMARSRADAWRNLKGEWVAGVGQLITAILAAQGEYSDPEMRALLRQIVVEIHARPNRVRHEMNGPLISIGLRGGWVRDLALDTAEAIGNVVVDHGQTGCVKPDAATYILKSEARKAKARASSARG